MTETLDKNSRDSLIAYRLQGYDVHGTIRRSSVDFRERIAHLEWHENFHLHYADLGDSMSIMQVVGKVHPDIVK